MKGSVKHTLDILSCSDGQVAKWNTGGSVWECASDDGGLTSESDPTVLTSVKDGVSWAEVTDKPAGFADGTDDGITSESDPQVNTVTSGKWCKGISGNRVQCTYSAPSSGGANCGSKIHLQVWAQNCPWPEWGGNDRAVYKWYHSKCRSILH